MAEYAVRNGPQFEEGFLAKNDPRFDFLKEGHHLNSYYMQTKKYFEAQLTQQTEAEQNGGRMLPGMNKGKPGEGGRACLGNGGRLLVVIKYLQINFSLTVLILLFLYKET